MPLPTMQPVKSSNVAAVGHSGDALYVQFHGRNGTLGPIYRYPTAGRAVMDEMLASPSIGRYVQTALRGAHRGELVATED